MDEMMFPSRSNDSSKFCFVKIDEPVKKQIFNGSISLPSFTPNPIIQIEILWVGFLFIRYLDKIQNYHQGNSKLNSNSDHHLPKVDIWFSPSDIDRRTFIWLNTPSGMVLILFFLRSRCFSRCNPRNIRGEIVTILFPIRSKFSRKLRFANASSSIWDILLLGNPKSVNFVFFLKRSR